MPMGVERRVYEGDTAHPIKPQLLAFALALLFADIVAVLLLQAGGLIFGRRAATAALAAFAMASAALLALPAPADAQSTGPSAAPAARPRADDGRTIQATAKVTFGYVLSGDGATDEASRQGLIGLGRFLIERTAVEPGEPFAVNILNDEIAFFPMLYWPVLANARPLPEATLTKIDAYMKQGGMIVFDTKDYGQGMPTGLSFRGEGGTPLQRLLGNLDIPRLEAVPEHHVLTKSFYLLRSFPGRWDGGQLWVEAEAPRDSDQGRQARRVDGVSSILVTSNDFAAAWARDDRGQYALSGGAGRRAPARDGLPHRRQHRHVRPDRQLQGRPGARAGPAGKARPMSMASCPRRRASLPLRLTESGAGPRLRGDDAVGDRAMSSWSIDFSPMVPAPLFWAGAVLAAVLVALLLLRRSRGALLRALSLAALLLALSNPTLRQEERESLANIAIVVVDESLSQSIAGRPEQTAAIRRELEAKLAALGGNLQVRWVTSSRPNGETASGTNLFADLNSALANTPPDRLAGVIMITDGQVHDVPKSAATLGFDAPVHALLTGQPNEFDRRIEVLRAPRYGIVGSTRDIEARVVETGRRGRAGEPRQRSRSAARASPTRRARR